LLLLGDLRMAEQAPIPTDACLVVTALLTTIALTLS
jgi:hypothetical protein